MVSLIPVAATAAYAESLPTVPELLKRVDHNMTFETRRMRVKMTSINPRRTREFEMVAYGRGESEAAIEYIAPVRDAGTRMLRNADELWLYMPSVEKVQKISGHMLRQGMMGTDVSYEDMVAASKLATQYSGRVTGSEDCGDGRKCWRLELTATDPSVSYPKRIIWVDQEYNVMARQELYALSGMLLKKWTMSEVKSYPGARYFPTRMEVADQLQEGTRTILEFTELEFGVPLEEEVFSLRWLERK
jgi:outer membrane lipoprotein-sorting protein